MKNFRLFNNKCHNIKVQMRDRSNLKESNQNYNSILTIYWNLQFKWLLCSSHLLRRNCLNDKFILFN